MIDPAELQTMPKEKLLEEYDKLRYKEEQIITDKVFLKEEILLRLKRDAEIWGLFSVTKTIRRSFKSVKLETARELGAITDAIDTKMLATLDSKGVKIEGVKEIVVLLIKNLEVEDK